MINHRLKNEHLLFLLALVIGLAVRFIALGEAPLSEDEAGWALKAFAVAKDNPFQQIGSSGSNQAYVVLTAFMFDLFGSSDFLARFWPALSGTFLVLFPYIISRKSRPHLIQSRVAIIFAFGIALAPGMVAISRQAGSPMMALAFILLGLALLTIQSPVFGGIFFGLGLLSGISVIPGLLAITLAWIGFIRSTARRNTNIQYPMDSIQAQENIADIKFNLTASGLRIFGLVMLATILLVSTYFFKIPSGLGSWIDTVKEYFRGWITPSDVPVIQMVAALLIYQPIAVIFSSVGIIRRYTQNRQDSRLFFTDFYLIWLILILLLTLIYPARQPADLIWSIIPMWGIAAFGINQYIKTRQIHSISVLQSILLVFLMALAWYTMSSLTQIQVESYEYRIRWIVVAFIVVLGALTTILIALGWSWSIARTGLVFGIFIGLALYSFSTLSGVAYLRVNQPEELWSASPGSEDTDLFTRTLQDLSFWETGRRESIDIVSEVDSPTIRWVLRTYPQAEFADEQDISGLPSILITYQSRVSPEMATSYRGQDFVWWNKPGWSGGLPNDFLGWFIFRKAPLVQESIILWARTDLFPGGTLVDGTNTSGAEGDQEPFDQDLIDAIKENSEP